MKTKSAAIVTIYDAPSMTKRGRNKIAEWLERQAGFLRANSKQLSKRFTARYLYSSVMIIAAIAASTTGCKTPAMTQAVVQTTVATGVAFGIQKSPQAIPYLKAATPIVCSAASGTNISPTEVISAIEAANIDGLKTPEAVIIMNGALSLYVVLYEEYGVDALKNQAQLKAYLQGTCNGLELGLTGRNAKDRNLVLHPHIR